MAAPRASENPEVQANYATHLGLTVALAAALRRLWPTLDLRNLPGTLPRYKTGVAALVDHYAAASVSLTADHFDAMRTQAGLPDITVPVVDPPPAEQVQASLGWATSDLTITGGDPLIHEPASADTVTIVQNKVEGAATKLVMDAGRNELIAAIEADTKARGWARVTRPGACYFCRMLATRGAVYSSREAAGGMDARGDINRYHNNCHCTIEPLFSKHYEPPAHTRADMALWNEVTAGLSGQDAINAFRRVVEGRSDGPTRGGSKRPRPFGFDSLTPDQLRHQLSIVEGLKPSDYRDSQVKRIRKRLADLGA